MTIDLLVGETLERKLADVRVPRVDIDAARDAGRRRRKRRNGVLAGVAFVVAFGTTAAVLAPSTPEPPAAPTDFPAMDFATGLQAVYDDQSKQLAIGGQVVTLDDAADLGASAVATPYGLVYFTDDQAVRLLRVDGQVSTIAPAPERPESFTPTVRFDNARDSVAWLTRADGKVTLSAFSLVEPLRVIGTHEVPCDSDCGALRMGGADQGFAFVSGEDGSLVIDPSAGPSAKWSDVTDGRVIDVRNRTILSIEPAGGQPVTLGEPFDGLWRLEPAADPPGLLTFDGNWEVARETTPWRPIGDPLRAFDLPLPAGTGPIEVWLDVDDTVLVRRTVEDDDVFYDCGYVGDCREVARFDGAAGQSLAVGSLR
jgi:hypothetical protein